MLDLDDSVQVHFGACGVNDTWTNFACVHHRLAEVFDSLCHPAVMKVLAPTRRVFPGVFDAQRQTATVELLGKIQALRTLVEVMQDALLQQHS